MTYQDADLRMNFSDAQILGAANSYDQSGIVRIVDLYHADVAKGLHHHLDTELEWSRAVSKGDKSWDLGPDLIAAIDNGNSGNLIADVHNSARDGFQFLFDSWIVADESHERTARGELLDRVIESLNHPSSLDAFRAITGVADIRSVNGQATRYLPGHFLTSHDDGNEGHIRVAAYVINLTQGWRTDWGGLLQFHNAGGDVPLALKPGFNTIHLFRVPQMHSVSYVAPFAAVPRYSITGWLRR
jgi:SM-20-related protein